MFGRRIEASPASPTVVAPPSAGSAEPRRSEQRQKPLPAWLLPWLMPLGIVLAVVVLVVAPGFVVALLGLLVIVALGWWLLRGST